MSEPTNQHYVPKVYLKAFANSQKVIYQAKKGYNKISQTTVSKICYEPNYYTIQREETKILNQISDPFHIEKNSFKKQENLYERLLKKFTISHLKDYSIRRSEARIFLDIITTIKRRNPSVRKILAENYKDYVNSSEFRKHIEPGIELAKKIDRTDPEEYIQKFLNEINNEPSRLHDIYLSSFLGKQRKVTERVLDTLMQFKLYIHHAPPGHQFLTSDNPGFTVVDDIVTNYGGLSEEFTFVFPLTPLCCLFIYGSEPEDPYRLDKPINVKHVNSSAVVLTNKSTAVVAREKVFSYSKDVLLKYLETEPNF